MAGRDGQATRRRVLDAALAEFAQRGIAGARVDRIAAESKTNKAQMYSYFRSKDGLLVTPPGAGAATRLSSEPTATQRSK